MKKILFGVLALITLAWGWDLQTAALPQGGAMWWTLRQEALYLSGVYAIALMSLAMMLATRPAWLERPLGGMDRVYRLHKWTGILAVAFAATHWLVEMSDDILKALVGRAGRVHGAEYTGLLETLRDAAKDMGEFAIYALLAMLVLTLWKRFPYQIWRHLHRVMPGLYLMLAFHAALLAPTDYWTQPLGMLLALLFCGGVIASVLSLAGRIGRNRSVSGTVVAVKQSAADVTELTCRLGDAWKGHQPGQFAFVTFGRFEGAHPFTIASADRGDRTVTFQIKALGDFTRQLSHSLWPGQPVRIEGPYGRFALSRCDPRARQIWIAGGIGVTPFLAWLESLQADPASAPAADLHYCTRDRESDPFVARLASLCATLPGMRLHVHGQRQGEVLTAETLASRQDPKSRAEVWFCGPQGLADTLMSKLQRAWPGRLRLHQEAFEMR
ncbi:ferric reductase-like transmembrane domain-containing protein [Janthinobacterium sp. 17J80-10]|uniref:ferredoxin reductase family protein n=1 Tax=Janthinobacterium sp. 17J80-10 TaxID=2497863 RepID=UPI0010058344|nr:ferric reductase-like transmembrane domain-containing protein [Janthinobacterium sp. 17J80-10]QAU35075.1 ferric reductase [Janthinobacterium sp. 17J80-10]